MHPALVTAIIGLVTLLVLFVLKRGRVAKGDTILILGPMGGGKTVLFHRLKQNAFLSTVTSMAINEGAFVPAKLKNSADGGGADGESASWKYVDIPGHGSFRYLWSKYLPTARAVIYVVDACNDAQWPQITSNLYELLVHPALAKRRVPFIILCNKSEKKPADSLITTLSADKIRSILEPALDKFRATKEGGPDVERVGGADSASAPVPLGRKGKAFKFSDSSCPVAFVEASAKENELDALFGKLRDIQSH